MHIRDERAWKRYHKHCLEKDPSSDMEQADFIAKIKAEDKDGDFVKQR